jgi:hypothetical protein
MALDIGGAQIQGGGACSVVNTSGTTIFKRGISTYNSNNFGYYENSGVPAFVAGYSGTDPGWVNPGASGVWSKISNYCNTTMYNRNSCYNTSTTRFTAPITGPYWFSFTTYLYTSNYVHPIFAVNGSATPASSTGYYATQYRIRGHGMVANYQQDAQIEETIYLNAGDFVEAYWYNGGTCYSYAAYSLFQGTYVG